MKVTKEEVEKAGDEWVAAVVAAKGLVDVELMTAVAVADKAWDKYIKLRQEYNNNTNIGESDATQATRAPSMATSQSNSKQRVWRSKGHNL